MAGPFLCVGIDHAYVRACLCDRVAGQWRLIAWLNEQAPVVSADDLHIEVEPSLVTSRIRWAAATLGRFLEHDLLPDPDQTQHATAYTVERTLLTVTPLPPRRIWVMALTPLWLSVLEDLIQSVEAHLIGVTIWDHRMNSLVCSRDLALACPDLIVVCGGYDMARIPLRSLGTMAQALADNMNEHGLLPVVYAGSREVSREFADILRTRVPNLDLTVVANLVPQPDFIQGDPLHTALHEFCIRTAQNAVTATDSRAWLAPGAGWGSHSVHFMRMLQLWQARYRSALPVHGIHYSGGNRIHVLLDGAGSVQIAHTHGLYQPDAVQSWPQPMVVSGQATFQGQADPNCVYDPRGFMPLLAPMYDIDPTAVGSILAQDLLTPALGA